ncbi:MAG: YggT family protein [Chloroflexota bacterium]|nr:YggT family protein [Chloroflexota bacterium]
MCVSCFLIVFLEAFINIVAQALVLLIFVRVIMSWVPMRLPFGMNELVWNVTEPVLSPIRRYLPIAGGMDFSPFIALLLIQILASVLLRVLPPAIPNPTF